MTGIQDWPPVMATTPHHLHAPEFRTTYPSGDPRYAMHSWVCTCGQTSRTAWRGKTRAEVDYALHRFGTALQDDLDQQSHGATMTPIVHSGEPVTWTWTCSCGSDARAIAYQQEHRALAAHSIHEARARLDRVRDYTLAADAALSGPDRHERNRMLAGQREARAQEEIAEKKAQAERDRIRRTLADLL